MIDAPPVEVDFLEAGSSGPVVMLVHSSASGARQWRRLMDDLRDQFRVRAINLFGYGKTPAWPGATAQSLDDQADLVEAALPENTGEVFLVGHSFGACVAMKAAARLAGRVSRLVLLEANPFSLLAQAGRAEAFAEAIALRDCIKTFGARGEWATAAERFADYWGGAGSWQTMTLERRTAFADAIKPNYFEWDAVINEFYIRGAVGRPASACHACDLRSANGFAGARDRGHPTPVVSRVDLPGTAGSRPHGAADAPGCDQSAGQLVSDGVSGGLDGHYQPGLYLSARISRSRVFGFEL